MLFDLLSVAYLAAFIVSGIGVSRWLFSGERPLVRIWLGCVAALVLLLWLPALWAFLLDFTLLAQLLALVTACCLGCLGYLLARRKQRERTPWADESAPLFTLLPLFVLGIILLSTHTIVNRDGALWVGQSTYGDLAMHLGFITSIAEQGTFPPMYSICPDTPVGYPFLSDSISSTFYVLGADLRFATMLPAMFAYGLVLLGVYLFFERWLSEKRLACFAALLFFVGGGFGFAYFFDLAQFQPDRLASLFTAFYETPTNYPTYGLRWVNPIADMLIPQRATLFGWALLFPCLYLLYRAAFERETRLFYPLGILAGALPLVHTHSFLALGLVSVVYFLRSIARVEGKAQLLGYLKYAGIVALLAGPQLLCFTFRQSGSFLHLNWNWDDVSDSFLWFYIKNWGLLFVLLPIAYLDADKHDRAVYRGILLLWLLGETVQFQPNAYDNNKILFIWFAFTCGLVGKWLIGTYRKLQAQARLAHGPLLGTRVLAAFVCIALFLSGTLTLMREWNSEYQLVGAEEVEAADFVRENTAPDATFLTYNNHNNAIAALTGRNIVCGSGTFLYFHGVDYSAREQALAGLFETPETALQALQETYSIDYVYIGPYERANYDCDIDYFNAHASIVFDNGSVVIYELSPAP